MFVDKKIDKEVDKLSSLYTKDQDDRLAGRPRKRIPQMQDSMRCPLCHKEMGGLYWTAVEQLAIKHGLPGVLRHGNAKAKPCYITQREMDKLGLRTSDAPRPQAAWHPSYHRFDAAVAMAEPPSEESYSQDEANAQVTRSPSVFAVGGPPTVTQPRRTPRPMVYSFIQPSEEEPTLFEQQTNEDL